MGFIFKESQLEIQEEFLNFWIINSTIDYTKKSYIDCINSLSEDFILINDNLKQLSEHFYKFHLDPENNKLIINDIIHIDFNELLDSSKPYFYFNPIDDSLFYIHNKKLKNNLEKNYISINKVTSISGIDGFNLEEKKNLSVNSTDPIISILFEDYCYENMKNIYYNEDNQKKFKQNFSIIRSLRTFFYHVIQTEFNINELFKENQYYSLPEILNIFSSKEFIELNEDHLLTSDYSFISDVSEFSRFVERNIFKNNSLPFKHLI